MKGLIYKDIVINKSNLVVMGIIISYVAMSLILFMFEPLEGVNKDTTSLFMSIIVLNIVLPTLFFDCSMADSKTKWNDYAMALPGGCRRMILVKYILCLMGQILAVALNIAAIFLCHIVSDIDIKLPFMALLLIVGLVMLYQALIMPMLIRGKMSIFKIISMVLFLIIVLGCYTYIALGDISFFTKGNLLHRILNWVMYREKRLWFILSMFVVLGVVAEWVSYHVSVLLYRRD